MLRRQSILLLLLVSAECALVRAAPMAAPASSTRSGEAEVRDSGSGLPCFTITESEERKSGAPNFEGITVYDVSVKPRAKMWSMTMPPNRTFPVLFSMCVPYGGRVQALPQTAAGMLEPGKVYEVSIDVRGDDTPNQVRSYGARFCLARQRAGGVAIQYFGASANDAHNAIGCVAAK
jgi:hypothetical protein